MDLQEILTKAHYTVSYEIKHNTENVNNILDIVENVKRCGEKKPCDFSNRLLIFLVTVGFFSFKIFIGMIFTTQIPV